MLPLMTTTLYLGLHVKREEPAVAIEKHGQAEKTAEKQREVRMEEKKTEINETLDRALGGFLLLESLYEFLLLSVFVRPLFSMLLGFVNLNIHTLKSK